MMPISLHSVAAQRNPPHSGVNVLVPSTEHRELQKSWYDPAALITVSIPEPSGYGLVLQNQSCSLTCNAIF
jgi:hypothetical protein